MEKIRVLVADDHLLVREGIAAMLKNVEEIELVDMVSNGAEVLKKIEENQVDVVVMDVMMPGLDGFETTAQLAENSPEIKILLLSMEVNTEFVARAIKNGAGGYLPKDSKKSVLVSAIKAINDGQLYFNNDITETIFRDFYVESKTGKKLNTRKEHAVSKREIEVLTLISEGKSNRQVADELFISVRTVDAHRNHIMKKINAKSTADLVKYAIKNEFISLD